MTPHKLPLVIEASQLQNMLGAPDLLPVAVCSEQVFNATHVPGSTLMTPAELVSGEKPAVGKLPGVERLSALFSRIGLTPATHVVAYDDEGGGWAGRLIWTLDVLGHHNYSYLDGGLVAWLAGNYPVQSGPATVKSTDFTAVVDTSQLVNLPTMKQQIGNANSIVWDARGSDEYVGTKVTALRNGHIPGAVNLDWLDLMDRNNDLRLRPLPELEKRLRSLGITADKQIITHCHTHHRSGLTYLVGKALGMNIKAYDGSWSEWGNQSDTPIVTGNGA